MWVSSQAQFASFRADNWTTEGVLFLVLGILIIAVRIAFRTWLWRALHYAFPDKETQRRLKVDDQLDPTGEIRGLRR